MHLETAKKMLSGLLDAANDSAKSFKTGYISYLAIILYVFVTVISTSSMTIMIAGDVSMPIVNVGVPVVIFFQFVPWIIVVLHLNILIQAAFYARKVQDYFDDLEEPRDIERRIVYPSPIGHLLGKGDRQRGAREILLAMLYITIVFIPIFIILYLQSKFLSYQSQTTTFTHRAALLADLCMIFYFWPRIVSPSQSVGIWWKSRLRAWRCIWSKRSLPQLSLMLIGIVALAYSFVISNVKGGFFDINLPFQTTRDAILNRNFGFPNRTFVSEEPDPEVLAAFASGSAPGNVQDAERGGYAWRKYARQIDLSNRSFRSAQFSSAYFFGAHLQGSDFSHSNFWNADLRAAIMFDTNLQGAFLELSSFQAANLGRAVFNAASLKQARFDGAQMTATKLIGVSMERAVFRGSDLFEADLRGSKISEADFSGAMLAGAKLTGSNLRNGDYVGADLSNADLRGAKLSGADFSFADLRGAKSSCVSANDWREVRQQLHSTTSSDAALSAAEIRIRELESDYVCNDRAQNLTLEHAICDGGEFFGMTCGYSEAQELEYYKELIGFLTGSLVCELENQATAAGIAYRVHRRVLIDKRSAHEVAAFRQIGLGLLDPGCAGAHDLPNWLRTPIERDIGESR